MSKEEDLHEFWLKLEELQSGIMGWYILMGQDHRPVPVPTLEACRWFEEDPNRRIVSQTRTGLHLVSTVFLGLDHNYFDKGPPILFETLVFDHDGAPGLLQDTEAFWDLMRRYCTFAEAVAGHAEVLSAVLEAEARAAAVIDKEKAK